MFTHRDAIILSNCLLYYRWMIHEYYYLCICFNLLVFDFSGIAQCSPTFIDVLILFGCLQLKISVISQVDNCNNMP